MTLFQILCMRLEYAPLLCRARRCALRCLHHTMLGQRIEYVVCLVTRAFDSDSVYSVACSTEMPGLCDNTKIPRPCITGALDPTLSHKQYHMRVHLIQSTSAGPALRKRFSSVHVQTRVHFPDGCVRYECPRSNE